MKEEMKQNDTIKKIKEQVEEKLKTISDNGIKSENLENLYKLIDIHKDISNEEYWKVKEEGEMNEMRYGNYDEYNGYYGDDIYGRRHGRSGQGFLALVRELGLHGCSSKPQQKKALAMLR